MGKHLVICGHGQGRISYDPGAVNAKVVGWFRISLLSYKSGGNIKLYFLLFFQ
ncbi:hypothetical protein [Streptococcus suis]